MRTKSHESLLKVSEKTTYTTNGFDKRRFITCYDENEEPFAVIRRKNRRNTFTVPEGTHYIGFGDGRK